MCNIYNLHVSQNRKCLTTCMPNFKSHGFKNKRDIGHRSLNFVCLFTGPGDLVVSCFLFFYYFLLNQLVRLILIQRDLLLFFINIYSIHIVVELDGVGCGLTQVNMASSQTTSKMQDPLPVWGGSYTAESVNVA